MDEQEPGRWESFVVRPWYVVDAPPAISHVIANSWIFREELASAMVDAALNGGEPHLLDNATLRTKGQAALAKQQ